MPQMPPSARTTEPGATTAQQPRRRVQLAPHPGTGSIELKAKPNGHLKALSSLLHVSTARAGQTVRVIFHGATVDVFTHDGEHLISYPRPAMAGMYYGPHTPGGTPIKGAEPPTPSIVKSRKSLPGNPRTRASWAEAMPPHRLSK